MAEIKFDAARMQEVLNRLDEIKEQLSNSVKAINTSLTQICSNITGEAVITILNGYTENNTTVLNETGTGIDQLAEYLRGKIGSYTSTEQEAAKSLTDVQSILNGLEK